MYLRKTHLLLCKQVCLSAYASKKICFSSNWSIAYPVPENFSDTHHCSLSLTENRIGIHHEYGKTLQDNTFNRINPNFINYDN